MKVILICEGCGKPASRTLTHYNESESSVEYGFVSGQPKPLEETVTSKDIIPNISFGQPLTPKGIAFKATTSLKFYNPLKRHDLDEIVRSDYQYWINLADLKDHILNNENWKKGYGCCGVIATVGKPNRQCACGIDIGYEFSECYFEHFFVPNEKTTRWDKA